MDRGRTGAILRPLQTGLAPHTGLDAPSCSTLYLDKPMRGHTLMQTIARANRVYGDKVNGLIVDYANVFQKQEKALAIYGSGTGGGDMPTATIDSRAKSLAVGQQFVQKIGRRAVGGGDAEIDAQ
jgi:type I restriction enzyme, R subunit